MWLFLIWWQPLSPISYGIESVIDFLTDYKGPVLYGLSIVCMYVCMWGHEVIIWFGFLKKDK